MRFSGLRTDEERLSKQMETISFIDNSVNVPEHVAWDMRPRDKSLEIAPGMHFNSHF
jgi:cytochrome c oxidase assembly protein Cox11